MTSFSDAIRQGIRNAYCSQLAAAPQWQANLRRVLVPGDLRARGDALARWVCDTDPSTQLPFPNPPFDGGQCPTGYLVNLVNTSTTVPFPSTGQVFATGPIRGVSQEPGVLPGTLSINVLANPNVGFRTGNLGEQWQIASVGRLDSQPDNCGDPDPIFPEPAPITTNINVNYGDNYNVSIPVVFGLAYISLDGRLIVPISIEIFPDATFDGTLELFPDFSLDLDFGGTGNPNDDGPEGEDPPEEPPVNPGDETDESEDETDPSLDPIYAVLIAAVIEPETRASGIFQEIGPNIFVPRIASVRFGTRIAGRFFWSQDIDVKGLREVVHCPFPWGATTAVVNPIDGVALSWAPIRIKRPEWPEALGLGDEIIVDKR